MRADRSAWRAASWFTACCARGRSSSSWGTLSCSSSRRGGQFGALRGSHCWRRFARRCLVGRGQGVPVGAQAFMALRPAGGLFVDAALLGGQHLDLLLHLHHAARCCSLALLGLAQGVFQVGQLHGLLFDLGGQGSALLLGVLARRRPGRFRFGLGSSFARRPLR